METNKPRGPSSIQDVLRNVLRDAGISSRGTKFDRIHSLWKEVAGPTVAGHARPVRLHRRALIVEVDSSTYLYELKRQRGERYRGQINDRLGSVAIDRIVFKLKG